MAAMFEPIVLILLILLTTTEAKPNDLCDKITQLDECSDDEGPAKPEDGQIVYLEDPNHPGYWYYPAAHNMLHMVDLKMRAVIDTAQHARRDIADTDDHWPGWRWHECDGSDNPDIVCLEAQRQDYRNYYFGRFSWGYFDSYNYYEYSHDPEEASEDFKFKIISRDEADHGIHMKLISLYDYNRGWRTGAAVLSVIVHIPPRCVGWDLAKRSCFPEGSKEKVYESTFNYKEEITKTSTRSSSFSISSATMEELNKAFTGSFGYTWSQSKSTSNTEGEGYVSKFKVLPGQVGEIWRKIAIYGPFVSKSKTTIICFHEELDKCEK